MEKNIDPRDLEIISSAIHWRLYSVKDWSDPCNIIDEEDTIDASKIEEWDTVYQNSRRECFEVMCRIVFGSSRSEKKPLKKKSYKLQDIFIGDLNSQREISDSDDQFLQDKLFFTAMVYMDRVASSYLETNETNLRIWALACLYISATCLENFTLASYIESLFASKNKSLCQCVSKIYKSVNMCLDIDTYYDLYIRLFKPLIFFDIKCGRNCSTVDNFQSFSNHFKHVDAPSVSSAIQIQARTKQKVCMFDKKEIGGEKWGINDDKKLFRFITSMLDHVIRASILDIFFFRMDPRWVVISAIFAVREYLWLPMNENFLKVLFETMRTPSLTNKLEDEEENSIEEHITDEIYFLEGWKCSEEFKECVERMRKLTYSSNMRQRFLSI